MPVDSFRNDSNEEALLLQQSHTFLKKAGSTATARVDCLFFL